MIGMLERTLNLKDTSGRKLLAVSMAVGFVLSMAHVFVCVEEGNAATIQDGVAGQEAVRSDFGSASDEFATTGAFSGAKAPAISRDDTFVIAAERVDSAPAMTPKAGQVAEKGASVEPAPAAAMDPVETTVEYSETSLAVSTDEEMPLANQGECWIHWYILLGIVVTVVYAACAAARRGLFSRKLRKYEDDLTGDDDPSLGTSSGSGKGGASPASAPKGSRTGTTVSAGLSE